MLNRREFCRTAAASTLVSCFGDMGASSSAFAQEARGSADRPFELQVT